MITRLSHTTIFVSDQDKAFDFYVTKLGCTVNTDALMPNGYRWLTINPPDQPDLEIVLMPILHESMIDTPENPTGFDKEARDAFQVLLNKGVLGAGVFYTPDCRASYEALKAQGVHFKGEPKEQFYGVEAVMFDGCGNWFSLTEPKAH